MLKRLLVGCMVACSLSSAYAQKSVSHRSCAAEEVLAKQNLDPKTARKRQQIADLTRSFIEKRKNGLVAARTGVLTIPVITHVIYNTDQENISDAQIQSQIDVLNEDFRKLNSDVGNVPDEFAGVVADFQIEFVNSQVTRKYSTRTSWGTNDAMKKSSQGGVDPIDPAHYMNMWICNIGGGILGYAQFPGGPAATDGVVFSPQYCGSIDKEPAGETFYLDAPFDKGRTATHEVGHYLNLRHIWGDGGCSVDDFVSDTPLAAEPNYGCPSYPSKSCSSNGGFTSDMFMNYMDYVDDACMVMFSAGQKARMDAIFEPGGPRDELGTAELCELPAPTGLAVANVEDYSFDLSWDAVSGALSYDVTVGSLSFNVSDTELTVDGLESGTTYACKVRARCEESGGVFSSALEVTTTLNNCNVGPVTLSIEFDEYPEETSWTLVQGETVVYEGGGYSGGSITETLELEAGMYTFSIYDTYGDGICCDYGNGFYSLSDGSGVSIISGGAYGSGESKVFCIEGDLPNDIEAPTAPTELVATVTETTATLTWTESSDNVEVIGYNVYQDGTLLAESDSLSYTAFNLVAGTSYTFTVEAFDAAGNVSSATSVEVTTAVVDVEYCTSAGNNSSDEYIKSFTLGSINNTSGNDGGYGDYTSLSTSLTVGASYNFTLTPEWTGKIYREAYAIWIDYNHDGDFDDANEKVYSKSLSTSASISGSFTVPSAAISGLTRMRVSMKYNGTPSACETFNYGEVEDYAVIIGGAARSVMSQIVNTIDFNVYPNPASLEANVKFNVSGEARDINVAVYDNMGKVVYSKVLAGLAGSHEETIDVSGLKTGLYHVVVTGAALKETRSLIVK